jgi:hypothetical protein
VGLWEYYDVIGGEIEKASQPASARNCATVRDDPGDCEEDPSNKTNNALMGDWLFGSPTDKPQPSTITFHLPL